MKTKNELAQQRYGKDYYDLCGKRQDTIDQEYEALNKQNKEQEIPTASVLVHIERKEQEKKI
jgi:hypothetical protein